MDSTRETNAAADAQADFEAICGVTYSSSNTTHVAAGVPLVAAKLMVYTGQADDSYYANHLKRLQDIYRLVLGRNRVSPTTDSTLTPSTPTSGAKPWSDIAQFPKYMGKAPSANTVTNDGGTHGQD